ncbi:dihydroneopterin aldolase [Cytobacillus purgationiresistens]|uniref:7,8-dihydroneopterin aldolase n=1 Tax=Cytobacillus purgationiresistens TaxID=863449 RepID=A0ABU0AP56_9BACI|nr:dihydroneopterin aldolase [Cytobacillus purgationiresistens]MDQ0273072.1 dihydroneopterin aldolase [Cytobacillus purgationiresistens]
MDKIFVNKMEFYGYHGVFSEETRLGQRFIIDLTVETNLKKAGETDDLNESINYAELYNACKVIAEGKPYKLVEAVAEKISADLLNKFSTISQVTVKVIKPDPPIPGHYESVAVEITRGR